MKELAYIKWVQRQLKSSPEITIPSGDDCAGIKIDGNKTALITTDVVVEGIDFRLGTTGATAFKVGYKALAVSISDIAAMGGADKLYAVATMALRKELSNRFAKELFHGMKTLARKFNIPIIGGDISSVKGPISISTTLLGIAKSKNILKRAGAKENDAIMVTGKLGGSILGKHLGFIPRLDESRILKNNYRINSMIDLSDGLLMDLDHILNPSGKSAILWENNIPISDDARKLSRKDKTPPLHHALTDGEDFELLFTLPINEAYKIAKDNPLKAPVSFIGIICKGKGINLLTEQGKIKKLIPKGYEHW
ncbi:MAG: thiamine-monophosphate kinase [Planctomycetes bacterium]|nr:thiamine-monophosphate kinase [Planctomycetota bacterium]